MVRRGGGAGPVLGVRRAGALRDRSAHPFFVRRCGGKGSRPHPGRTQVYETNRAFIVSITDTGHCVQRTLAVQVIGEYGLHVRKIPCLGNHHPSVFVKFQGNAVPGRHAGNGHVIFHGSVPGLVVHCL